MFNRKLKIFLLVIIGLILSNLIFAFKLKKEIKVPTEENSISDAAVKYKVKLHVYSNQKDHTSEEEIERIVHLLEENLSIIDKSTQFDLDAEQEGYLVLEAPNEIEQILRTEGYFNNQIQIHTHHVADSREYLIEINLNQPVRIKNKIIVLSGDIENDKSLLAYYKNIANVWKLNTFDIFKQKLWNTSKANALKEVKKKKYPLAVIKDSYVQIDPFSKSVLLGLEIDSGDPIQFGDIKIVGAERYPESIARNLADFKKGATYDENVLSDYLQKLEKDAHYSEVVVTPLFDDIKNNQVPILVAFKEQLKKSFEIELTYDSDEGFGNAIEYQHNNFLNKGYVAAIMASYNQYEQELSIGITQPQKANGRFWTARTNYFHGSRNGLDTKLWSTGLWYVYIGKTINTWLGLEYFQEKLKSKSGKLGNNDLLMATIQWKINQIQTILRPEKGYYLSVKVGTTLGMLASSTFANRYEMEGVYYLTPWDRKYGTFVFKSQIGYISTRNKNRIPDELKFKIGGSGSLRGYSNDSIGIKISPYTFGGLAKFTGSVEYQKPVHQDISVAIFHDVGDVKNQFKDMKLKHSTGIGLRWFSVVAPVSFDVAYAHDKKKFGWHLSLGARF